MSLIFSFFLLLGQVFAEHDLNSTRPDSVSTAALTAPSKTHPQSQPKNQFTLRCSTQLASPFVKDSEMECRAGNQKVTLNHAALKQIENKVAGYVQSSCPTPASTEKSDLEKLRRFAKDNFQNDFVEAALEACKKQFQDKIGVIPENISMQKPQVYYYAKKGEANAKEYPPERFEFVCAEVSIKVFNTF